MELPDMTGWLVPGVPAERGTFREAIVMEEKPDLDLGRFAALTAGGAATADCPGELAIPWRE